MACWSNKLVSKKVLACRDIVIFFLFFFLCLFLGADDGDSSQSQGQLNEADTHSKEEESTLHECETFKFYQLIIE